MMDDTTQFLSQEDQEAVNAMFDTNSQTADTPQPGFFTRARVAASEVPGALFGAAQDTANDAKAAALGIPHALANTGLDVAQTTVTGATAVPRQYANELAAESGVTLKPLNPTGTYYPQLAENPARGVLDAGVFGPEQRAADAANQWITDTRATANEMYRPDPQTTGVVGNALFGLADVGTRIGVGNLLAPGTGLLQAAASTGFERTQELEHPTEPGVAPVDETTAIESGVLQGGSLLAMGGTTGALGKTTLRRMITAALTNELFTAGATAGDSAILRANGYDKLADQERWNDAASLISNGLIGLFFGAFPHEPGAPSPRALPGAADAIDAALTQKNAAHVMEVAPGVPADPASQRMHVDALDTAVRQVANGEPVNVDPIVRGANFVPRELSPASVGTMIDTRLGALDQIAQGVLPREQVQSLVSEANDLEDIIRGEYAARDSGVLRNPANMLSPDELQFAENRLAEVKQQLERHRYGQNAATRAANLRGKLERIDNDRELTDLVRSWFPEAGNAHARAARDVLTDAQHPELAAERDERIAGANALDLPEATRTGLVGMYQQAARAKPGFDRAVQSIADAVGGKAQLAPLKGHERAAEKAVSEYAGDASRIKDLVRATIVVDRPEQVDAAIARAQAMIGGKIKRNSLTGENAPSEEGYRDVLINGTVNGHAVELQINYPEMMAAKHELHQYYKEASAIQRRAKNEHRDLTDEEAQRITELRAKQAEGYAAAWEATNSRNLASESNVPLWANEASGNERPPGTSHAVALNPRAETGTSSTSANRVPGANEAGNLTGSIAPTSDEIVPRDSGEPTMAGNAADAAPATGEDGAHARAGSAQPRTAAADQEGGAGAGADTGADQVARARQVLAQEPNLTLDGQSAGDAMRAADEEVIQAERQAQGVQAALACFLRFGSDV